jgi:hypothetical protein
MFLQELDVDHRKSVHGKHYNLEVPAAQGRPDVDSDTDATQEPDNNFMTLGQTLNEDRGHKVKFCYFDTVFSTVFELEGWIYQTFFKQKNTSLKTFLLGRFIIEVLDKMTGGHFLENIFF